MSNYIAVNVPSSWSSSKPYKRLLALILGAFISSSCNAKDNLESFTTVEIGLRQKTLTVELAVSPEQKAQGLMYREKLAPDAGMLFVLGREQVAHFYMKNTLIPLSIAYIDKNGIIKSIKNMEPLDERTVSSDWPVYFALEMNKDWFKTNGIQVGDYVEIPEILAKKYN